MDQAQVQQLIDAALATAAAATAAPATSARTTFSLTPGVINAAAPWDYSTSEGVKLYFQATTAVVPTFDGTLQKLKIFLQAIASKAMTFGWKPLIFIIPDGKTPPTDRDLLTKYGLLTAADVKRHAMTYHGQNNRAAQASTQLARCILASLDQSTLLKLMLRSEDYTLAGGEDGPCMLRALISVVSIETRATISCVRTQLKKLPELMDEVKSDVTEFNLVVAAHLDTLRSVDEKCEDLLTDLFAAYQTASDKAFVRYIADKEGQWEDGTVDYTPETFMHLAENNYKTRTAKKTWNEPSREEADLIALQATTKRSMAELVALQSTIFGQGTGRGGRSSGRGGRGGNRGSTGGRGRGPRDNEKWAWKLVAPTGTQPKKKTFNGKEYLYCPNHGETKWVLLDGHADGCRNDASPSGAVVPNQRVLQYAQALMHAMEENDDGGEQAEGLVPDEEI
jgi:uncharacterized membrane protein YgcG